MLGQLVTGKPSKLIASALGISEGTVKIHLAAITRLFESNDQELDAEAIYAIAASAGC